MAKFTRTKVKNNFKKNTTNTYLTFRSKWEIDFAMYLENHKNIKNWKFDYPFKYLDRFVTKKNTIYYVDFLVEFVNGNKAFFEVKPVSTLKERVNTKSSKYKKIHKHNYLKNLSKFDSITGYCRKTGMKFYLVDKSKKRFKFYTWDPLGHKPVLIME